MTQTATFSLLETTIEDIIAAYQSGELTARELVEMYLRRIEELDRAGPNINCVITVNPEALAEADRLDAIMTGSGPMGPLHGIPVLMKDQMDVKGTPTTLGSVIFKDYYPDRDSFVAEKLKQAGAILLAKVTLGELGGGDTHGTLFGSTRNPYDLERTVGGSSGGTGAGVNANFAAIGVGQEGFSSIRRPAAWNSCVGMRPTPGLVSRAGVYGGWPSRTGSLGPITRTVKDLATLLDVMVGYDPEDPMTAHGYGKAPVTYTASLDPEGLKGARIGIIRESMGNLAEPDTEDYAKVTALFDKAVEELKGAGATVIDPITIPSLNELLAKRAGESNNSFEVWMNRSANPPFASASEMRQARGYAEYATRRNGGPVRERGEGGYYEYLKARDELETIVLKVMADNKLDAIVHKSVEHQPTLIKDGINPPYTSSKGSAHLNTFLIYAASITVPAGFTEDGLPNGITFFGRPYSEPTLIKLAYAYEQATHHRVPPTTTPALPGEP